MPTKRTRRTRNRLAEITAYQIAVLLDTEILPEPTEADEA
jgi:hypothetical protein